MSSPDQSNAAPTDCTESQRCLLRNYDAGEFAHVLELSTVREMRAAVGQCGDPLLAFLFMELAGSEDCADMETAVGRVEMAIGQLTTVRDALLVQANSN